MPALLDRTRLPVLVLAKLVVAVALAATGASQGGGGNCLTPENDDCCPKLLGPEPPSGPLTGPRTKANPQGSLVACVTIARFSDLWDDILGRSQTASRYASGLTYTSRLPDEWESAMSPPLVSDPAPSTPPSSGWGISGISVDGTFLEAPAWSPGAPSLAGPIPLVQFAVQSKVGNARWYTSPKTSVRLYSEEIGTTGVADFFETHHGDGTIARFESYGTGHSFYRIAWVRDPFDNQITFAYNGGPDYRLDKVTFPNGVEEKWSWSAAVPGLPLNHEAVQLTYSNVQGVPNPSDLTVTMVFDGTAFATGKLTRVIYPKVPYVAVPGSGLIDTGTTTDAYRVYDFRYGENATHDLLTSVYSFRTTTLTAAALANGDQVAKITYVKASQPPTGDSRWRVSEIESAHIGDRHLFSYTLTGSPMYVSVLEHTDPRDTEHRYDQNSAGQTTKYRITPQNNAVDSPRKHDPYSQSQSHLHEPDHAEWEFTYDAGCSCQKVKTVETPSGRVTTFEWDATTKRLRKKIVPNPSNDPGDTDDTVTYEIQYTADGRWPKKIIGPYLTWDAAWTLTADRADPRHGKKPSAVTWTSTPITIIGAPSEQLTITQSFDSKGRTTSMTTADGVTVSYSYNSDTTATVGTGRIDKVTRGTGGTVVETDYSIDDWGRLLSVTRQNTSTTPIATTYTRTASGILLRAVTGDDQAPEHEEQKLYYDFWNNHAVTLTRNKTSAGAAPTKHGQTSNARDYLRHEWHHDADRLIAEYVDRRPLDGDETGDVDGSATARMLKYTYSYYPDGTPNFIGLPNDATRELTFDGYGTLFKSEVSDGTATTIEDRYYIDAELELRYHFRGDDGASPAVDLLTEYERTASGTVQAILEPEESTRPQGYPTASSLGGARRDFTVDKAGRVTFAKVRDGRLATDPLLSSIEYRRDELGRVRETLTSILGAGASGTHTVQYRWRKLSQLHKVLYPAGRVAEFDHDALSRVILRKDGLTPTPNQRSWVYKAGTSFVERIESLLYDDSSTPGATTYHTEYTQDALGRVHKIKETGKDGQQTPLEHTFTYYSTGDTETYTGPLGRVRKFLPDALGRLTEWVRVADDDSVIRNTATYEDWKSGYTTQVIRKDGRDRQTVETFDYAGRPYLLQHPGANLADPPTGPSHGKPHSWLRVFDGASRVSRVSDGDGVDVDFHYDGLGRLLVRESPNVGSTEVSPIVSREVYARDRLGRVTQTASYTGPLGPAMAAVNIVNFAEDTLGRVHSEAYWYVSGSSNPTTVQSQWLGTDPDFRNKLIYPSGRELTFTPDPAGRLQDITWNEGPQPTLLAEYEHFGYRTRTRATHYGTATGTTTRSYDNYGRLSQILDEVGPTTIAQFDFEYDAAGNLKKEKYAKQGTWTPARVGDRFIYDDFDRLKDAWLGVDQVAMDVPDSGLSESTSEYINKLTYDLDDANNRSSVTDLPKGGPPVTTPYTTETDSNRYEEVDGLLYTYDNRGNLIFDGLLCYVYDFKNRLSEVYSISVAQSSSSSSLEFSPEAFAAARSDILKRSGGALQITKYGRTLRDRGALSSKADILQPSSCSSTADDETATLIAQYAYDCYDRRVIRTVTGDRTYFYAYDGWNELEELIAGSPDNIAVKRFVWGERLNELVAYERKPVATWESYFAHQLGHESVTRLVSTAGAVVESVEYTPYGKPTVWVGGVAQGEASTVGNPYSWKGHRVDPETGLVYMRYRYYDSATGRFVTQDPLGLWADDFNAGNGYPYPGNAPTNFLDPLGLQGQPGRQSRNIQQLQQTLTQIAGRFGRSRSSRTRPSPAPATSADLARILRFRDYLQATYRNCLLRIVIPFYAPGGLRMEQTRNNQLNQPRTSAPSFRPSRGEKDNWRATALERQRVQSNGDNHGCCHCGAQYPEGHGWHPPMTGTTNWVVEHWPPRGLYRAFPSLRQLSPMRLYAQCVKCQHRQGGLAARLLEVIEKQPALKRLYTRYFRTLRSIRREVERVNQELAKIQAGWNGPAR